MEVKKIATESMFFSPRNSLDVVHVLWKSMAHTLMLRDLVDQFMGTTIDLQTSRWLWFSRQVSISPSYLAKESTCAIAHTYV